MLRNALFQAHWLIGITAGVVLAVVGATGALLSFEHEIVDWLNEDVRTVAPRSEPQLTPQELLTRIREQFPGRAVNALVVSNDPAATARVTLALKSARANGDRSASPERQARPAAGASGPPGRQRGETRYADPYTGAVIAGKGDRGETFFRTVMQLHRWLTFGELGNRDVGKQIVGASTALLTVLALSGLYLRWPARRALDWRVWLTFNFRLKGRRFLWHLHSVTGTWVLVFYLMMSLTGLYWSYDWYRNGMFALAGVDPPARNEREGPPSARGRDSATAAQPDLTRAWGAFLHATFDVGYSTANINLSRAASGKIEIRYLEADPRHERAFNTLEIETASGKITRDERYTDKTVGGKFMSSIFPLHSGSFFGWPGMMLFMIASLAMPVFAVTGWMLYLERRRRKAAARAELQPSTGSAV